MIAGSVLVVSKVRIKYGLKRATHGPNGGSPWWEIFGRASPRLADCRRLPHTELDSDGVANKIVKETTEARLKNYH